MTTRTLPPQALLFSLGAMAIPVVSAFNAPSWMEGDVEVLMWLTALIPAFLLTFYKGWRGVSLSLALGMVVLTVTQIVLQVSGAPEPNWRLLLGVIVVFVAVSLGLGYFADILARERLKAETAALVDPLTGLANRRHATVFLDAAFSAATRGTPLSVVIFDLDHFKAFNDNHGHQAGDQILRVFGAILKNSTRRMDLSARYGGEEFIAILANCEPDAARGFARRILGSIREAEVPWGRVTASAGVACYQEGMGTPDLLVAAADQALYRAKANGRDRAVLWESDPKRDAGGYPHRKRAVVGKGGPRILVVDDDSEIVDTVEKILLVLGYDPRVFIHPQRALEYLQNSEEEIALFLVDVLMPEVNGLTLVEKISKLRSGVPVLYMSGSIQGEVNWPGVPGAATGFIQKPMSLDELQTRIEEAIRPKAVEGDWGLEEDGGERERPGRKATHGA